MVNCRDCGKAIPEGEKVYIISTATQRKPSEIDPALNPLYRDIGLDIEPASEFYLDEPCASKLGL